MLKAKGRPGFTLMEMLFSTVILSVVTGAVFTLFYSNQFAAIITGDQSTAMSDTQAALRKITADLTPASGFATPTYTGGLRVTDAGGSAVEYYLDGTALKRTTSAGATTLVLSGVVAGTGLSLSYLNSSMTAIAGPMDSTKYGQAVAVDVTVTTNLDHTAFGQVSRTTRVMLRNKIS
jgi:prepilin-type N-terminal cleavage/methylation domain-containing protein